MTRIYSNPPLKNTNSMLATRPNNLSLVGLYLSLCISFLSFGHPPYFLFFYFFLTQRQKAPLYKSSRKHTTCMRWKFWDLSNSVQCKHPQVHSRRTTLQLQLCTGPQNIPWDSPISISISPRFIYNIKPMVSIHRYLNQSDWLLLLSGMTDNSALGQLGP